jgi:hypothetical protein
MVQVSDIYPIKRTITREYDKEGRLLKETVQEFDTEKKNAPEGGGYPWYPYPWYPWSGTGDGIKITYSTERGGHCGGLNGGKR